MSFITALRADRLISQVQEAGDPSAPAAQKALDKLRSMGPAAIPKLLEALQIADKRQTVEFVEVLTALTSDKSFAEISAGLSDENPRVVSGTAWALSSSRQYNPNRLLELLSDEHVSKPAVLEILGVHKSRLNVRELLRHAYELDPGNKAAVFKLIGELADEDLVPDLVNRLEGKDPVARVHIINLLAQFGRKDVRDALQRQLRDNHKMIRQAALNALSRLGGELDVALMCSLLTDPDIDVVDKATDIVIRMKHPDTIRHLLTPLKDESEYARRAAVEVLNEIGTAEHIKYLLEAIRDEDWWVRERASDALAKIGGPRVVKSVLQLVNDKDEDIRRAAIEILVQTKDERAVQSLIVATRDSDWWVRERAADALGRIGSTQAVPALKEMLKGDPKSLPSAIRALAQLGDASALQAILPFTKRPEKEIQKEAMRALTRLANEDNADSIRIQLQQIEQTTNDATISREAMRAMRDLDSRFATGELMAASPSRIGTSSHTLLSESPSNTDQPAAAPVAEPAAMLDIAALQPGETIEGRYRYIEKIGKGAFGTVLLVEDTVVDERLILKFLNPNVSSDEEMRKRFVHELRYSRKITHKNVIRIYDFVYLAGNYAISMEYFPSHPLGAEIKDSKALPVEKAVKYACDIATGMIVAHQQGIIHRDLKPANILINDEGLVKIVDFGVAAAAHSGDTQLTKTGYVIGSPKYMAPEQILGKKVDEQADIYSLGVILYEMLTGVPPYTRGDHMSVMYQHVQGKARPAQEINPAIPDELNLIVSKAMAVDKLKRYGSMEELRSALEPFLMARPA